MKVLSLTLGLLGITGTMLLNFVISANKIIGMLVGLMTMIWLGYKIYESHMKCKKLKKE